MQADRILRYIFFLNRGLLAKTSGSVFTVTANCVFERLTGNVHMFVFNFSAQI